MSNLNEGEITWGKEVLNKSGDKKLKLGCSFTKMVNNKFDLSFYVWTNFEMNKTFETKSVSLFYNGGLPVRNPITINTENIEGNSKIYKFYSIGIPSNLVPDKSLVNISASLKGIYDDSDKNPDSDNNASVSTKNILILTQEKVNLIIDSFNFNFEILNKTFGKKRVVTNSLVDSAINEDKLDNDSVGTEQLSDDSISTNKLDKDSVTSEKIEDDSITLAKFNKEANLYKKILYTREIYTTTNFNQNFNPGSIVLYYRNLALNDENEFCFKGDLNGL